MRDHEQRGRGTRSSRMPREREEDRATEQKKKKSRASDGQTLTWPDDRDTASADSNGVRTIPDGTGELTIQGLPEGTPPAQKVVMANGDVHHFYTLPGPRGPEGLPGERGDTGLPGTDAADGPAGPPGDVAGPPGDPGVAGPPGPPGPPGTEVGSPGVKGDTGPDGEVGEPGPPGQVGPPGPPPDADSASKSGPPGPPGEEGDVGPPGDEGLAGMAGLPGMAGDPGPMGPPGLPGLIGIAGPPGVVGPPGRPGFAGAAATESLLLTGAAPLAVPALFSPFGLLFLPAAYIAVPTALSYLAGNANDGQQQGGVGGQDNDDDDGDDNQRRNGQRRRNLLDPEAEKLGAMRPPNAPGKARVTRSANKSTYWWRDPLELMEKVVARAIREGAAKYEDDSVVPDLADE